MSFSSTPITAGGASDYMQKFKKHFGDRPTSFTLSDIQPSSCSSTSSDLVQGYGGVNDPFAASSSTRFSSSEREVERASVVDQETHTQLANLGWRIRSRVNQGYTRTSTTLTTDPAFASEQDILRNVTNTRRGWSRVSTAPTSASCFETLGPRPVDEIMTDVVSPTTQEIPAVQKRRRSTSPDQEEVTHDQGECRRIAGMPKLSFSSTSSASSVFSNGPDFASNTTTNSSLTLPLSGRSRSFARTHSERLPHAARSHGVGVDVDMMQETSVKEVDSYDFHGHFNRTDF